MTQNTISIANRIYQTTSSDDTFSIPFNEIQDLKICDIPNFCQVNIPYNEVDDITFRFEARRSYHDLNEFYYSFSLAIYFRDENKQRGYKTAMLIKNHFAQIPQQWKIFELPFLLGDDYCISYNLSNENLDATTPLKSYIFQIIGHVEKFKGNKIRAFLCHTSADKEHVEKFANLLRSEGAIVWFDKWEIKVGESIVEKINSGLESMTHLIIFLSKKSVDKPWVKKELSVGLMRKLSDNSVNVIPILMDKVELPAVLKDIKYADCTDSQFEGFNEAIKALVE